MNCIVICCDTFRYDALTGDSVLTPNLDALVEKGVSFTSAFGEGLPTIQARRSMFTGRRSYPWRFEMDSRGLWPSIPGWHRIPSEQDTLAECMLEAGYTTGFVADTYHMFKATQNFTRGFSSWNFIRGQESDPFRSGPLSAGDTSAYHPEGKNDTIASLFQYLMNMQDRKKEEDYLPAQVFRKASRWLEDNRDNTPFFLWVDSFAPHEYWDPPMEYADEYYKADHSRNYIVPQWINNSNPDEDAIERTKALYKGYVTFVDKWIGHFFESMDKFGLWNDTLVLFTSDHGTELWDKERFGKSGERLYAYNTQVPLVISDPEEKNGNRECGAFVQHHDLLPTICTRLGVPFPEDIDGIDLGPGMTGNSDTREKIIIGWYNTVSIRSKEWNLLMNADNPGERTELYDLKNDPEETEDVSSDHQDIVDEYTEFFKKELDTDIPVPVLHTGDPRQIPPRGGGRQ